MKLFFCQNDPLIGEPFWQNNSLVSHILFELQPIIIFSPVANFGNQSLAQVTRCVNFSVPYSELCITGYYDKSGNLVTLRGFLFFFNFDHGLLKFWCKIYDTGSQPFYKRPQFYKLDQPTDLVSHMGLILIIEPAGTPNSQN